MAYYNKIGLLILNEDKTKFMICEPGAKYGEDVGDEKAKSVTQFIMPGGQLDGDSDMDCLQKEIREELSCEVDMSSVSIVGDYTDVAASSPDRDVLIRLYQGNLIGEPRASSEIGKLHWVGKTDTERLSPIIKNKILPDLIAKGLLQ